jgi:isopenicillin N synthase-like dioxygenase
VKKYGSGLDMVCRQLLRLMAEALGIPSETYAGPVNSNVLLRWNLYPACPSPSDVIGAAQHTDPFLITLLLQDKVGGLQINKDGEWKGVRPIEGALTINVCDMLHVSFAFPLE